MNCFSEPIANVFANRLRETIHRSSNDDREREMQRISSATANVANSDDRERETAGFERHGERVAVSHHGDTHCTLKISY